MSAAGYSVVSATRFRTIDVAGCRHSVCNTACETFHCSTLNGTVPTLSDYYELGESAHRRPVTETQCLELTDTKGTHPGQ